MAHRFHRQDAEYLSWRQANLHDGYVLNVAGSESRLHRASCDSLQRAINDGKRLTWDYPKLCSTSIAELNPMLGNGGRRCPTCAP